MIPLLGFVMGAALGASGVVAIQALAAMMVGTVAAIAALRYVDRLEQPPSDRRGYDSPQPAFASGRTAVAARFVDEDAESR